MMPLFQYYLCLILVFAPTLFYSQFQHGSDINGWDGADNFGHSVSLSADGYRVVIGAPWHSPRVLREGHAQVWEWNGVSWFRVGGYINGENMEDALGFSVSIDGDGNRIAVGAIRNNQKGSVKVFEFVGNNWVQLGQNIEGEFAGDQSGWSVSLAGGGSRVAIGAPQNSGTLGHVRIFEWTNGSWVQVGNDIDGESRGDKSGYSTSISHDGNRVAIGAMANSEHGWYSGHVRIFEWRDSAWIQLGSDIDGIKEGSKAGYSVSLNKSGSHVALSAFNGGYVQVFEYSSGNWKQIGTDIKKKPGERGFGNSISLSGAGNTLVIGVPDIQNGITRIFDWTGQVWAQRGSDIHGEAVADRSGYSVSLSENGNTVAIGAIGNDDSGPSAGHVRVYDLQTVSSIKDRNLTSMLEAYPNPSDGIFYIPSSRSNDVISIVDIHGKKTNLIVNRFRQIDIRSFVQGQYFIQMVREGHWTFGRLIKK